MNDLSGCVYMTNLVGAPDAACLTEPAVESASRTETSVVWLLLARLLLPTDANLIIITELVIKLKNIGFDHILPKY